jgi:hypothetical protein
VKADVADPGEKSGAASGAGELLRLPPFGKLSAWAEYIVIPVLALLASLVLFGIFVAAFGKNPIDLYFYMYQGAFGTWFSWQNTLTRAAPLILTALCTALPAQLGMVIIGGEGALLIGARSPPPALRFRCPARRRSWSISPWRSPAWSAAACGFCCPARYASFVASTKRSPACSWSISRSPFSTFWSKDRCVIRPA